MNLESPIKTFPEHWRELSLNGKREYLIAAAAAADWSEASSLLGRHAAAVRARRKLRRAGQKFERQATPGAVRERHLVPGATVAARCDLCSTVVFESLRWSDGSREKRVVAPHRHDKFCLLCLGCVETAGGVALIERGGEADRRAA
jgi:hypothetical protein